MSLIVLMITTSFIGSVAFSLFLRRLDRPQHKLAQVKRLGEIQASQMERTAGEELQKIKDATLEFEVLFARSRQVEDQFRQEIEKLESMMGAVIEDRKSVESIAKELSGIAHTAGQVSKQVERLDMGLERLSVADAELTGIHDRINDLQSNLEERSLEAESRLGNILTRLIDEAEERTGGFVEQGTEALRLIREEAQGIAKKVEDQSRRSEWMTEKLSNLDNKWEEKWNIETSRLEEKFLSARNHVEEKLDGLEKKVQERVNTMEAGLGSIRQNAVESLQSEINRMRTELEGFNLETIASRDQILNETHRMAEHMNDQIRSFQEKYLAAENKIMKLGDQQRASMDEKIQSIRDEFEETENRLLEELQSKVKKIGEEIHSVRSQQVEGLEDEAIRLQDQLTDHGQNIAGNLDAQIRAGSEKLREIMADSRNQQSAKMEQLEEHLRDVREVIETRADELEGQVRDISRTRQRIEEVAERARTEISESRDNLVEELERRAERFISEQDEKLDKLNLTIDEKISRQIARLVDHGQLQIEELERRTSGTIHQSVQRMEGDLESAKAEFIKMRQEVQSEVERSREIRDEIIGEIQADTQKLSKFEEKLKLIDKAEDLTRKLDQAVEVLTQRLTMATEENEKIEQYVQNFEQIRFSRRELENELRQLDSQRERMLDIESQMKGMDEHLENMQGRFASVAGAEKLADRIEERVEKFEKYRKTFDHYLESLEEKRRYIDQAIAEVQKGTKEATDTTKTAEDLLDRVQRAELRQEHLTKSLEGLESRATSLGHLDHEIQRVESRFEQMDGLMSDLEVKQQQIGSMARKMDEIGEYSGDIKHELESLLSEANEKMDRLSAFYQTVDRMLEAAHDQGYETPSMSALAFAGGPAVKTENEAGAEKARKPKGSVQIADWKKDGILSLYLNHKWDPDLIAERMKIDPAVVRQIIANH